jgi:hypothetical protein
MKISDWLNANVNIKKGDKIRFADTGKFDRKQNQWIFNVEILRGDEVINEKKFRLKPLEYIILYSNFYDLSNPKQKPGRSDT